MPTIYLFRGGAYLHFNKEELVGQATATRSPHHLTHTFRGGVVSSDPDLQIHMS